MINSKEKGFLQCPICGEYPTILQYGNAIIAMCSSGKHNNLTISTELCSNLEKCTIAWNQRYNK